MRENGFRAWLTSRIGSTSISSYLSNARRVERALKFDLDACDLTEVGLSNVRRALLQAGVPPRPASDCLSALRQYREFTGSSERRPKAVSSGGQSSGHAFPQQRTVAGSSPPPTSAAAIHPNKAGACDIFISYARSTEAQAKAVEEALTAKGYAVWRDKQLAAHGSYADVIRSRLDAARAVIVLWSAPAVNSDWVRSEADYARCANKLVQAALDGARLPMPFDQLQCANLAGWRGEPTHPGWGQVLDGLGALLGSGADTASNSSAPGQHPRRDRRSLLQRLFGP